MCSLLAGHLTAPVLVAAQPESLSRCFQRLAEARTDPPPETIVNDLVGHGIESISFLYAKFESIDNRARYRFGTKVIPRLPPAETNKILLTAFRRDAPVAGEAERLIRRAKKEGQTPAFRAAYAKIEGRFRRLRWTTDALGNVGAPTSYDVLHPIYLQHIVIGGLHPHLARALHGVDPNRAIRDFTALVRSRDETLRLLGVSSFNRTGRLPSRELVAGLIDDPVVSVRQEAAAMVLRLGLDCLDFLIELRGHHHDHIRFWADTRLRTLAHMSEAEAKEMLAAAGPSATPADVWRTWWQRGRRLTEEQRRREGLTRALNRAEDSPNPEIIQFLSGFLEYPEVYPVLARAAKHSDPELKKAGIRAMHNMAVKGRPDATDFLLDFCAHHALPDTIDLVGALARTGHPRAAPVLLEMLEQSRSENTGWARRILRALGDTGDGRALEPVLEWLVTPSDGTEQHAATALAKLAGADTLQPTLLKKLVEMPNHNTRYAIRKAIESIGGDALGEQLVRILPKAAPVAEHHEGPQKDVLLLMEAYPDPSAKPVLQALLKTDDRYSRLYAARALAKLGDYSGVPAVLEDLFAKRPVPHGVVSKALKDIGAPGTRERLEALCRRVDGKDRTRVLGVIGQQEDRAYLPFLDKLVNESTDPQVVHEAAAAIGTLIYRTHDHRLPRASQVTGKNVVAAKRLLRFAFHGTRLRDADRSFPDHVRLGDMKGAVLNTGHGQYLFYKSEDGSLREMSAQNPDDAELIERPKPRSERSLAYGSLQWIVAGNYMYVSLNLNHGGASYLFQMKEGKWTPLSSLGGWIE